MNILAGRKGRRLSAAEGTMLVFLAALVTFGLGVTFSPGVPWWAALGLVLPVGSGSLAVWLVHHDDRRYATAARNTRAERHTAREQAAKRATILTAEMRRYEALLRQVRGPVANQSAPFELEQSR